MVKELPPRLSILLAFIVFQIISFTGILLRLSMESILYRAIYGVVFASILGYVGGILFEYWQEKEDFNQEEEILYQDNGLEKEEKEEEEEEEEKEEFKKASFPQAKAREGRVYRQKE